MGFAQIGYQVFKLVAHQRLHELAKGWEERYPGVDIVLIEPESDDELMFQTSMMSFTSRVEIARHGFESVTKQLAGEYDRYQDVAERHGLEISAKRVRKVVEHFDDEPEEVSALAQDPRGHHRRAAAPGRLGRLAPASRRSAFVDGSSAAGRWRQRSGRAMRTCWGSPRASPAATSTPARARRAASSAPCSVGCAAHTKLAWLSVTSKPRPRSAGDHARALLADRAARARSISSEQLCSASSAPAWEISETPRSGSSSASSSPEPGPPIA